MRWFKSTSLTAGKVELASLRQVQPPQPQPTMNHAINSRLSRIEFLHLSGSLDPGHLSHFWKWLRCPILRTIMPKTNVQWGRGSSRFVAFLQVHGGNRTNRRHGGVGWRQGGWGGARRYGQTVSCVARSRILAFMYTVYLLRQHTHCDGREVREVTLSKRLPPLPRLFVHQRKCRCTLTFCGCITLSNNTAELSAVPHVMVDVINWWQRSH